MAMQQAVPLGDTPSIVELRGERVVLDQDLARFFGVETRVLNQAIKRNRSRFTPEWAFQLSADEFRELKSQSVISRGGWGGRRTPPWAFSEHGIVMAATVMNSEQAIQASQHLVRSFVDLRRQSTSLVPTSATPSPPPFLAKMQQQLSTILEAELNPKAGTTVREEAEDFINEGLSNLKSRLKKAGLENEEIEARVIKYLAEAEETRARAATEREMTEKQRLKNVANRLRLLINAELAISGAEINRFLAILDDLAE